jgi:uncharacterized protein involved in exopolysaccharide biosynthesis
MSEKMNRENGEYAATKVNGLGATQILDTIAEWRRFIFFCALLSIVISTIFAFLMTPKYKAIASVLPAEKADLFGSMEGVSSLVKTFSPSRGLAALAGNTELDRYMAILKSNRVLTNVINKFDLVRVYDVTSYPMENTMKELISNVEFDAESEGNLTIVVFDADPQRAANMANFFVEELNRTNSELQVANAKANRIFIEARYYKNLKELASAEDSLKAFQKYYGVIAMPEQTEATVKAAAELDAQIAMKEVQLSVLERTVTPDHPSVISTKIEIDELRKKIHQMNYPKGNPSSSEMKSLVPMSSIPELGAEYMRRYREVEMQYKILQFITPLFEQAKVEEQRQTPSVLVLDQAFPAERKSKPKRLLIILGGLFVGLLGSIAYVGTVNRWRHEKDADSPLYKAAQRTILNVSADIRALLRRKTSVKADHGHD